MSDEDTNMSRREVLLHLLTVGSSALVAAAPVQQAMAQQAQEGDAKTRFRHYTQPQPGDTEIIKAFRSILRKMVNEEELSGEEVTFLLNSSYISLGQWKPTENSKFEVHSNFPVAAGRSVDIWVSGYRGDGELDVYASEYENSHPGLAGMMLGPTGETSLGSGISTTAKEPYWNYREIPQEIKNSQKYVYPSAAEDHHGVLRNVFAKITQGSVLAKEDVRQLFDVYSLDNAMIDRPVNAIQGNPRSLLDAVNAARKDMIRELAEKHQREYSEASNTSNLLDRQLRELEKKYASYYKIEQAKMKHNPDYLPPGTSIYSYLSREGSKEGSADLILECATNGNQVAMRLYEESYISRTEERTTKELGIGYADVERGITAYAATDQELQQQLIQQRLRPSQGRER